MAGPSSVRMAGGRRISGVETAATLVAEEGMEPDLREKALKPCAVNALSLNGLAGWTVLHGATTSYENGRPVMGGLDRGKRDFSKDVSRNGSASY